MDEKSRIEAALIRGDFRVSLHARLRMAQRNASDDDLIECGRTAKSIVDQGNGKYRLDGHDLDGDDLIIICAWSGETVIVTIF